MVDSRNPYLIMQQSYKKYFAVCLRNMNGKCPREKPPSCPERIKDKCIWLNLESSCCFGWRRIWGSLLYSGYPRKKLSLRGIFWFPTIHIAWKPLIFKQHELSCSIIISSIAFVPLRLTAGTWFYDRWNLARFKELDSHIDLGIALKT